MFVTVSQSGRSLLIDRPIFLPPFDRQFCLAVVPAACFPPVAQLAIDAGSARLDWTRLRSCEQHTCNAAQTRHPQKLGSGVVLWWIGTVLGAPIFWPLFSDRLVACRSERSQCRSGTSRPVQGFDYSIIRRGRDRRDETRRDRTRRPFAVRARRCKRALYQTAKERRGAERREVERSGGTGVEARFKIR